MRTPLLPFDALVDWAAGLQASGASNREELQIAIERDRNLLVDRLRKAFRSPVLKEALLLASPELHETLESWLSSAAPRQAKVEHALSRYFSRMAGRATPFGLFAAVSVGKTAEADSRTTLRVADHGRERRYSRLDNECLYGFVRDLVSKRGDPDWPNWVNNSSLYAVGGRIRYAEQLRYEGRGAHSLVEVDHSPHLDALLEAASIPRTRRQLVEVLLRIDHDLETEDAEAFLSEVAEAQILVPAILPPVTSSEPLQFVINQLAARPEFETELRSLHRVQAALQALDVRRLGLADDVYVELSRSVAALSGANARRVCVQVDLIRDSEGMQIGSNVLEECRVALSILYNLTPAVTSPLLDRFCSRFEERFGDREIAIAEALDPEFGIDIELGMQTSGSALLERIPPPRSRDTQSDRNQWGPRWAHLLRAVEGVVSTPNAELNLDDLDLNRLRPQRLMPFPDAITMMATIAASSEADVENGRFRLVVEGAAGPPGVDILGRFAHADARLRDELNEYLRAEEACRPECIYAEIVHLPEDRVANIVARPALRDYEIVYLATPGVPTDRQIGISDLMVSVHRGRIVLRSARLDREVVPRMTAAHNFRNRGVTLYKFLCLLQQQDLSGRLSWDWGPLAGLRKLPRVVRGRIVLALAQWRLGPDQVKGLGKQGAELFISIRALQAELGLPRFVGLVDGDNVLPVDLDNILSVEVFAHWCKQRGQARLTEIYPAPSELLASGSDGSYVHQLVVPFVRSRPPEAATRTHNQHRVSRVPIDEQVFAPGSEWLTLKIYAGRATVDQILSDVVYNFAHGAVREGLANSWFYLRYSDPNWHLRLRMRGRPDAINGMVAAELYTRLLPFLRSGAISRIQHDTYVREVRRYGGLAGVEFAEQLFHHDSECALELVRRMKSLEPDARWMTTLFGVDRMLSDLGLNPEERLQVVSTQYAQFSTEFDVADSFVHSLGEQYRGLRTRIEALCSGPGAGGQLPPELVDPISDRSSKLDSISARINEGIALDAIYETRVELARSFIHMFVNRMTRSETKVHEMIICNFLQRVYESRRARGKRGM